MAEEIKKEAAPKKAASKKVKVEVIAKYLDLQLNERKNIGDTFEVDPKRANELVQKGIVKKI